MHRTIYTNRDMEPANPAEFGLEALQGTAMFRPVGAALRIPRPAVWPVDAQRRTVPHYQRPPAEGASGSYPRGEVVSDCSDDCEVSGSIYLIAVPRDVLPPIFYGNALLQRMRAVLLSPDAASAPDMADHVVNIPFEDFVQSFGSRRPHTPPVRPVSGEILRDEQGHFYERNGSSIRRLRNLSSSRRGELLETPALEGRPRTREQAAMEPGPARAFHQFFRDPGESRILCWGDYKSLLQAQVARPERLRDNHRLSCFAQVYENFVSRTPEAFARECFGDIRVASQLFELTDALADRLRIATLLPPARPRREDRRDGVICAGDRIVRLHLAVDPTAEAPAAAPPVAAANAASSAPAAVSAAAEVSTTFTSSLKTAIPERFLAPWEIQRTREQVLSDMQTPESGSTRLLRRIRSILSSAELKTWRRQLWGKTADEQLWGVRPPKGSLRGGEICDWAKASLAASGYDTSTMLREWEIFWRQKGL
jgi:hypothetical protein